MYCCPSTVPSLRPAPPLPKLNVQYIQTTQTVCGYGGWGGGGVELCVQTIFCKGLHSVSDQIQNLQNCFTTPNKMTSKDDIQGLVSLKFLRPCSALSITVLLFYYLCRCVNCWRVSCHQDRRMRPPPASSGTRTHSPAQRTGCSLHTKQFIILSK